MTLFLLCTRCVYAQGGPPLLTDDPETPGNRNWEINIAWMQALSREVNYLQVPLLDINYGLGERIQLKYQTPYVFDNEGHDGYRGGPGNSLMGVKWRFYQQNTEGGWNISTYPQLEINNPSDSVARGLVERGPRFLLPIEVTHVFGPLEMNFEGGYWFNREPWNERILGLAIGHQFTSRLEGLAEVYDDVLLGGPERVTTLDVGGRYQFHRNLLLLFMAGRTLGGLGANNPPAFISYIGLQVLVKRGGKRRAPNRHVGLSVP
jgi:hypothetical protein